MNDVTMSTLQMRHQVVRAWEMKFTQETWAAKIFKKNFVKFRLTIPLNKYAFQYDVYHHLLTVSRSSIRILAGGGGGGGVLPSGGGGLPCRNADTHP